MQVKTTFSSVRRQQALWKALSRGGWAGKQRGRTFESRGPYHCSGCWGSAVGSCCRSLRPRPLPSSHSLLLAQSPCCSSSMLRLRRVRFSSLLRSLSSSVSRVHSHFSAGTSSSLPLCACVAVLVVTRAECSARQATRPCETVVKTLQAPLLVLALLWTMELRGRNQNRFFAPLADCGGGHQGYVNLEEAGSGEPRRWSERFVLSRRKRLGRAGALQSAQLGKRRLQRPLTGTSNRTGSSLEFETARQGTKKGSSWRLKAAGEPERVWRR